MVNLVTGVKLIEHKSAENLLNIKSLLFYLKAADEEVDFI